MTWRRSLVRWLLLYLVLCPFITRAQDQSGTAAAAGRGLWHPDGRVGHIALDGFGDYASVSTTGEIAATDAQRLWLGLDWVAARRLTALAHFGLLRQDSTSCELTCGIRYYFKTPGLASPANADGPIGGLAATVTAGVRFSDRSHDTTRLVADFGLILPVSVRLTLSTGYRHYEEIEWSDISRFSAALVYYFATYTADSVYANPDGPVGYPVLRLFGGVSEKGFAAGAAILFPLDGRITLRAQAGLERTDQPYQRSLTAGAGFVFYSGN